MLPSPPTEEGIDFLRGGGARELSSWLPRAFSVPKNTDTTKEEEQAEET